MLKGDITTQATDAIVNAANSTLLGGGGVDGAIHRAAGPELLAECKQLKRTLLAGHAGLLPTGEAVLTRGYRLPAKYVIHTVGPIYKEDSDPEQHLQRAYENSLRVADHNRLHSIAFPSIGTGAYGCPLGWAASIALTTIHNFLQHPTTLTDVRMVLYSQHDYEVYRAVLQRITA
ncbi:O-acetyl-ADP-ribose deacetylase [Alicyclobacillus cycloheptanicus]|nr:O-acetyl-ADP-ribose deacetylase [Alicyclobacillus cycloheptanicus]